MYQCDLILKLDWWNVFICDSAQKLYIMQNLFEKSKFVDLVLIRNVSTKLLVILIGSFNF